MNTIIDLNTTANVTFVNEADYEIVFGTNAGNTTANIDAFTSANISKQTTLTSITDTVRDLLIGVEFSNVGVVNMAYSGPYSNISLQQIAPAAWRINGIRSVAQYDEAFANVRYSDQLGAQLTSPEYSYVTTVNDQSGNTRSWTTTVDVLQQPSIAVSGPIVYDEDTITNVTQVSALFDPLSTQTFRLFANVVSTYGTLTDGVSTTNSIFIDGNGASLNAQIAAGAIKFWPASDLASNVANAISFSIGNTSAIFETVNANIQIGNVHDEFSLTSAYNYSEDSTVQMVFDITDLDSNPGISYVSTFAQTSGDTSQFYINGVAQGYGNPAVLTNSKANINVANVSFLPYPDSTANVGLTYSQVKVTPGGNVVQASNVAITLTNTASHNEYAFPVSNTYAEDTRYNFGNTITDLDTRAQSYTIELQQTSGNIGQFYRGGSLVGFANSVLSISNSKANINNTVSWQPPVDYTGNVSFTYNQSKVDVFGNTIVQASNVVGNITNSGTNPEVANMINRTITANTVANIFATSTPSISDGPDYGQLYTITLSSPVGRFGNSAANAAAASTYTYTGNIAQVNNEFTNMKFVNNRDQGATTSNFTYTQSRDGVLQVNTTPTLTVNAGTITASTYEFTSNTTFTPTFEQYYWGNVRYLGVGGGGGGAGSQGGGGGGGGKSGGFTTLQPGPYSIVIGAGGASATLSGTGTVKGGDGGSTYVVYAGDVYFEAPGGEGGTRTTLSTDNRGGNSQTRVGGTGRSDGGGGGAAAGSADGGNATFGNAGDGAPGGASTITGTTVFYGGGGGGGNNGAGGTGGGGSGGLTDNRRNGTNGLGGGGGGGLTPGNGGSGRFIFRIT